MAQGTIATSEKLIIIGGSAGSLEVILNLLPGLKSNFIIPVIIVIHRKNANDNTLANLLSSKTLLSVKEIEEKERIKPGNIYLVPGDYHVLLEQDHTFSLDYSEKINYSRPSIDVVFESAAAVFGSMLTCILLSGANADGTEGMKVVQRKGGLTIAQLPSCAAVAYMPEHAIFNNVADHIFDVKEMTDFINSL